MFKRFISGFLGLIGLCLSLVFAQVPDLDGRVVFISNRNGCENLWIHDLSNNDTKQITNFPGEQGITILTQPKWSNDGKQILFSGYNYLRWQIYVINDDGSNLMQITNFNPSWAEYCNWDPVNKDHIYYINTIGWANIRYHKMNIITQEDIEIPLSPDFYSSGTSGDLGFDITSDGSEILFVRDHAYQYAYVGYQDMSGNSSRIIVPYLADRVMLGRINRNDAWIVLHQGTGFPAYTPHNIIKIDKDGNQLIKLTFGQGSESNSFACWTKGGNDDYILFESNRYGDYEIVAMKADGISYPAGMINLSNNPATDKEPDWTPHGSFFDVKIDIKPGSYPNTINMGSNGTVPVAIFSMSNFDATTVDPQSVTLAGASVKLRGKGTPMSSFEDINGDGLIDIIVHISTEALQLNDADTKAVLEGKTYSGLQIMGVDSVRIIK